MLPVCAGSTLSEKREKTLPESENLSQKTLDSKYDGYMRGLGGAKNWKC